MKPTRAQYFFARSRPLQVFFVLLLVGAPLYFAYAVAVVLSHIYEPLSEVWNLVRLAFFVMVALILGFLSALVAGSLLTFVCWPVLEPLYAARAKKNGAPFRVGDWVQILVGRHKGRVGRVYSDWRHNCVRVELSEKEKAEFTDIFSDIELLREDIEGDAPPNSRSHSQLPSAPGIQSSDSQRT